MNKLRDKLDPKYLKVCTYAAATVILVVITIMILAYSGGFWHTLWTMFTAMLKPIIIGSVICYLFLPLIKKIENMLSKEEKPWRRTAAVAIFYGVIALILLLLILVLFFALKGGIDSIREMDFKAISDFVVSITHRFSSELKAIEEKLATSTLPIGKVGDILAGFIGGIANIFSSLLFGVIFSIYFMIDEEHLGSYWVRALELIAGEKTKKDLKFFAADADRVFSGYIRGQFIDALIVGISSSIVLSIAGVPYSILIGVLIGIGNLIPYVGPVVGYGAVIIICLLLGQFDKMVIGILIIAVLMFVDGNIINPRLLSDNVEVHPALVIAALLAGGAIGGFVGMLVAVPVAALLKLQFDRYLEKKEKTAAGEEPPVES